jgi:hypothetical protein
LKSQLASLALAGLFSATISAQDVTVYDEGLQNGFADASYGGVTVVESTDQAHGGTKSIAHTGNNYSAISARHATVDYTAASHPTIHFWVHGGTTGGQQLYFALELNDVVMASGELDTYISGGAPAANSWREVTVPLATLGYNGAFDRIDIGSDVGGAQATFYIDDIVLQAPVSQPAGTMQIEHDVTVGSMVSDRFTWQDSNNEPRVAVLAHNDGQVGPGGSRGGELREFRYEVNGATRTVAASSAGAAGFGYVVAHPHDSEVCLAGPDSSMLGHFVPGTLTRVFEGRHHAIFRFTQSYPRYCQTGDTAPAAAINLPVTIDWMFSTGRDHPLWAVTLDMNAILANTLLDDARGPYGELLFDGAASEGTHSVIAGVGWGDRYKFATTTSPVTYGSSWTWNVPNTIPYVKLWTTTVDATMGTVQTQPITQQDAGGYYGVNRWNSTSAAGSACPEQAAVMPCDYNWPYQSIQYSIYGGQTRNTRLAWGTNFGFLGQSSYYIHGSAEYGGPLPDTTAPGWPRKSYSTYVVFGKHSTAPVEAQVTQVETIQTLTLTTTTGSVATTGPGGAGRSDTVDYMPVGYDHVYGALTFSASSNNLDANIAVGTGTLKKPLFIIRSFSSASYPTVKLAGATLVADTDYYASLRASANELWITINRDLTGPTNHLEILGIAAGPPSAPTGLLATASTTTKVDLSWTAVAGADSYQIDRKAAGGDFVQINTSAGNTYSDMTAAPATSYLYRVRAVNGSGTSGNSNSDLATTVIFTNHPLASGVTVKSAHVTELRTAANAVRALAGVAGTVFSDSAAAGTAVKGLHLTELRTAVDGGRSPLSLSTGGYTDDPPAGTTIKAVHVQELRGRVE